MANLAFPRAVRLRIKSVFRELNRSGSRLRSPDLIVRYRLNGLDESRFGLTVSRRVGNAVARNRVKRHLREAIRHHRSGIQSFDIVVIAKTSAARLGHSEFQEQVAQLFAKLPAR
jgi:ribonuclease P protein component